MEEIVGLDKKWDPTLFSLQETHFRYKDMGRQSKTIEKECHANTNQKKAGVVTLISDKVDVRTEIKRVNL